MYRKQLPAKLNNNDNKVKCVKKEEEDAKYIDQGQSDPMEKGLLQVMEESLWPQK